MNVPVCACGCGQRLELRHALSREMLWSNANWEKWRVRFRCPRCRQATTREFEVRADRLEAQPLEVYEREVVLPLGAMDGRGSPS